MLIRCHIGSSIPWPLVICHKFWKASLQMTAPPPAGLWSDSSQQAPLTYLFQLAPQQTQPSLDLGLHPLASELRDTSGMLPGWKHMDHELKSRNTCPLPIPDGPPHPSKKPLEHIWEKLSCFISQGSSTSNQQAPWEYATEDPVRHSTARALGYKGEKRCPGEGDTYHHVGTGNQQFPRVVSVWFSWQFGEEGNQRKLNRPATLKQSEPNLLPNRVNSHTAGD